MKQKELAAALAATDGHGVLPARSLGTAVTPVRAKFRSRGLAADAASVSKWLSRSLPLQGQVLHSIGQRVD
jgi:hypothetical protein